VTALRHALLQVCDEKESDEVVRRILGAIDGDLTSGRRSYKDTLLVLRQMRSFLKLPPVVDDQIRGFMVDSYAAKADERAIVESRVREWLTQHAANHAKKV
jgi:hypothetical protein